MKNLACLLIILLPCLTCAQNIETSFRQGTYPVGFQSVIEYDLGRPPLDEQQAHLKHGRAVRISCWYPAEINNNTPPANYQAYTDLISQNINPSKVDNASRNISLQNFRQHITQLGGDSNRLASEYDRLNQRKTNAYFNARRVNRIFPLIVFPESPHLNNIMCEYLASHGYIVASLPSHGSRNAEFEWQSVKGMETLIQDCQFAINHIKKKFSIDDNSMAVMGIGMNASAGLLWMMREPRIKALVSLEGGILTNFEYNMIQTSAFFDMTKANAPMLIFHSPHEAVKPELAEKYKYADRQIIHVPQSSEFHYLNFGIWERDYPGLLGKSPGETADSYISVNVYVLNFLDWQLKNKPEAIRFFQQPPERNHVKPGILHHLFKKANEIPPSRVALDNLYAGKGFDSLYHLSQKYLNQDREAFSYETFYAVGQRLMSAKQYDEALRWALLFQQSYPESVTAFTLAGRAYLESGLKTESVQMYSRARDLLATDIRLRPDEKQSLRDVIEQRLESLKQ